MFPTHVGMNRHADFKNKAKLRMFPTHVGMNRLCAL